MSSDLPFLNQPVILMLPLVLADQPARKPVTLYLRCHEFVSADCRQRVFTRRRNRGSLTGRGVIAWLRENRIGSNPLIPLTVLESTPSLADPDDLGNLRRIGGCRSKWFPCRASVRSTRSGACPSTAACSYATEMNRRRSRSKSVSRACLIRSVRCFDRWVIISVVAPTTDDTDAETKEMITSGSIRARSSPAPAPTLLGPGFAGMAAN